MNMDNHTEVLAEVRLNRNYIIEILQRVARLEEKHHRAAVWYGILGGFFPSLGAFIYWLVSR